MLQITAAGLCQSHTGFPKTECGCKISTKKWNTQIILFFFDIICKNKKKHVLLHKKTRKDMITIRQAHINDAAYIAEGIYEAFLLAGSAAENDSSFHQRWLETLAVVCAQLDTHYSYTNTLVAEVDGKIAGIMIAVDGKKYRIQREKMYPQLKSLFDEVFGVGWDNMDDEAQEGELYVDSLAVFTPYRHQGIGTRLLLHAKKRAQELDIPVTTLAVEPMNPAKILYQEIGFRYNRSITIFNEEYHLYMANTYEK